MHCSVCSLRTCSIHVVGCLYCAPSQEEWNNPDDRCRWWCVGVYQVWPHHSPLPCLLFSAHARPWYQPTYSQDARWVGSPAFPETLQVHIAQDSGPAAIQYRGACSMNCYCSFYYNHCSHILLIVCVACSSAFHTDRRLSRVVIRISSMVAAHNALWIGTENGIVVSFPFSSPTIVAEEAGWEVRICVLGKAPFLSPAKEAVAYLYDYSISDEPVSVHYEVCVTHCFAILCIRMSVSHCPAFLLCSSSGDEGGCSEQAKTRAPRCQDWPSCRCCQGNRREHTRNWWNPDDLHERRKGGLPFATSIPHALPNESL